MLAVPPQRSNLDKDGDNKRLERDATTMEAKFSIGGDEFPDFSGANNLLDSIDFDDLFMGMHDGSGDELSDLEMDPELLLAEFGGEEYSSEGNNNGNISFEECDGSNSGSSRLVEPVNPNLYKEVERFMSVDDEEEIESKKDHESESTTTTTTTMNSLIKERYKGKKSSLHKKTRSSNNNHQEKRKAKVDWTPELHKRFVEAVAKLGVDKAVPSRILELMGIHSLTRHNIASHLQKYRSHKKHLLAREAQSTNWSTQTRQIYGFARREGSGGCTISPWHHRPAMVGFPPMTTMQPHHFRPLHVWGHPSITTIALHTRMPMWPKHLVLSPSHPQPTWAPPQPDQFSPEPSFGHSRHQHRFTAAPMAGIPPNAMYKLQNNSVSPSVAAKTSLDPNPWNERIDATIGDVLAKPWLPLPLGLKPPSVDTVLMELQRQGIAKIPPS